MKRFILLISIMCSCFFIKVFAQQSSFTFPPTPNPLAPNYVSSDFIKLGAGFDIKPIGQDYLRLKIDETQIFQTTYNSPSTDNSLDVQNINFNLPIGNLAGSGEVGSDGTSNYNLPIPLPPGTKGMLPTLSISYNSQMNRGILGLGWSLNGLSTISRIPKTYYLFNDVTAVDLTNNDQFALDGNRLVLNSSLSNGADGAIYGNEEEFFGRIISHEIIGNGPKWFEVIKTDGTKIEYGNSEDSRFIPIGIETVQPTVFSWKINKITDRYGNYLLFHYKSINNENVIDFIEYTGNDNAGVLPYNKIQFIYEEKTDKSFYFIGNGNLQFGNVKLNSNLLLMKIKIYAESQIRDEYSFEYFFDNISNVSKLKKINKIIDCIGNLNPIKLIWGEHNENEFSVSSNLDLNALNIGSNPPFNYTNKYYSGDFNGDGKTDLFVVQGININNDIFYGEVGKLLLADENGFTNVCSINMQFGQVQEIFEDIEAVDLDNDGIDEILFKMYEPDNVIFKLGKFDGTNINIISQLPDMTFTYHQGQTLPVPLPKNKINFKYDFNGDGKTDIVVVTREYVQSPETWDRIDKFLIRNSGIGFSFDDVTVNINTLIDQSGISQPRRIEMYDFNGNGKPDIIVSNLNGTTIWEYDESIAAKFKQIYSSGFPMYNLTPSSTPTSANIFYFGDFNGDGKADVLYCNFYQIGQPLWRIAYSTGNYFSDPISINEIDYDYSLSNYRVVDINKDGRDDIIENHQGEIFVYINKGDHFDKKDISAITGVSAYTSPNSFPVVGDFNGDGKLDFLNENFNTKIYYYEPFSTPQYIKSIYDGFNNKLSFEYKPLTLGYPFYTKLNTSFFPFNDVQFAKYNVSKMTFTEFTNQNNTVATEYYYEGLKRHLVLKKSLGYSLITKVSPLMGTKSVTTFETIGAFFKQMRKKEEIYALNNNDWQLIKQTINLNEIKDDFNPSSEISKKRSFYFERKVTVNDLLNDIRKETGYQTGSPLFGAVGTEATFEKTFSSVDPSGTISKEILKNSCFINPTYNSSNVNWNIPWFASQLTFQSSNTTVTEASDNYTRSKTYGYSPAGYLETIIDDASNPDFNISNNYLYSEFGQIISTQKNPPTNNFSGLGVIETTNSYDPKGRFIVSEINTFGNETTYEYEPKYGNLTKVTDINHLVTKYNYDNFGRKIKTTYPDNTMEVYEYSWSNGNNNPNNALFKISKLNSCTPTETVIYDAVNRAVKTKTINFNNETQFTETFYNNKGQTDHTTLPYINPSQIKNIYYTYDYLGRKTNETRPDGSFTNYEFPSRSIITANGGNGVISQTQELQFNNLGQITSSNNNNVSSIHFGYNSAGLPVRKWVDGMPNNIELEYNIQGNQTKLIDPDLGEINYHYNAFGQLVEKTEQPNANSPKHFSFEYNSLGQITQQTQNEGVITYNYYTAIPKIGKIKNMLGWNNINFDYDYDILGREFKQTETVHDNGNTLVFEAFSEYDDCGRIDKVHYSNPNLIVKNTYNNAKLSSVGEEGGSNRNIWSGDHQDVFGHYDHTFAGASLQVEISKYYDENNGRITGINAGFGLIQDFRYTYDLFGNLTSRSENLVNSELTFQSENYTYDNLNRLLSINYSNSIDDNNSKTINYDNSGNITQLPEVGNLLYNHETKIHAVTQVSNGVGNISNNQDIQYTSFNKVSQISENDNTLDITYAPDYSRAISEQILTNGSHLKKYYALGCIEQTINEITGAVTKDLYLTGGDGLAAIYRVQNTSNTGSMYYILKDNLSSFDKVLDESGQIIDSYSFDAWGKRVGNEWNTSDETTHLFQRGYTGHEHLDAFGLINMNGRMFDPMLARFLSPDPILQDENNTQNYNRYSYCLNNPFRYFDPSGFEYEDEDDDEYHGWVLVGGLPKWSETANSSTPNFIGEFFDDIGGLSGDTKGHLYNFIKGVELKENRITEDNDLKDGINEQIKELMEILNNPLLDAQFKIIEEFGQKGIVDIIKSIGTITDIWKINELVKISSDYSLSENQRNYELIKEGGPLLVDILVAMGILDNPAGWIAAGIGVGLEIYEKAVVPAIEEAAKGFNQCGKAIESGNVEWMFSDKRLKTEIIKVDSVRKNLLSLNAYRYVWKNDIKNNDIGLIAQEVEIVYPELVTLDRLGYKKIAYYKLIPILIEALKEQDSVINSQNSKIQEQTLLINDILLRLNRIEKH